MRISFRDFAITFLLIIFITWHPFFTHGEINLFETGLYLPGIQAILNGQIPYHDFFHLRGPLELYLPALLMHLGEPHLKFLSLYFYLGTVLTLLVCAAIICTLYRTRFFLYITVPILIAKTFPRVVFTYWGGFRYAFGLLAIFFAIRAFKSKKSSSLFWAGLFSALGFLTSIEIGFCAFMAVMAAFVFSCYLKNPYTPLNLKKNISTYLAGVLILLLPYALYLLKTDSWEPYLNSTYTVITQMQNTFAVDDQARLAATPFDILRIMLSPGDKHFKHITPLYTYVFLFIFLIWRVRTKKFIPEYIGLITLGAYGLIMYLSAFRLIEGAQFEMALQPQKIIMFFLLEEIFLTVKSKNFPKIVARILIFF